MAGKGREGVGAVALVEVIARAALAVEEGLAMIVVGDARVGDVTVVVVVVMEVGEEGEDDGENNVDVVEVGESGGEGGRLSGKGMRFRRRGEGKDVGVKGIRGERRCDGDNDGSETTAR